MTYLLVAVALAVALAGIFIDIRNRWVYYNRMSLNRFDTNGIHVITQYIGYSEMMMKFWIWDINRMKRSLD